MEMVGLVMREADGRGARTELTPMLLGALGQPSAYELMRALYQPFMRNPDRLQLMDLRSAEFTKYAANAMLATRISFMNELARLAERVGADIELVRRGIGSDPRIGTHFLYPGIGWGGSCFPKDVQALVRTGREHGVPLGVLEAVAAANERQKQVLVDKVVERFGADLSGATFALWGLLGHTNVEARGLVVQRLDSLHRILSSVRKNDILDGQSVALEAWRESIEGG